MERMAPWSRRQDPFSAPLDLLKNLVKTQVRVFEHTADD